MKSVCAVRSRLLALFLVFAVPCGAADTIKLALIVRFLADAGISPRTVTALQDQGHHAVHIRDIGWQRATDQQILDRLRQVWPKVRIVLRGDSGFCRHRMLSWCERNDVGYIVGIARNTRLEASIQALQHAAAQHFDTHATKVRWFTEFYHGAKTWSRRTGRRVN